jgi:hypothetical protein
MRRDNDIFFRNAEFPHDRWADLLSIYDATEYPTSQLDHKHLISHN